MTLPISPMWLGRKTYSTVVGYSWEVKRGDFCTTLKRRMPINGSPRHSFRFYFDSLCDAYSISLKLWMKNQTTVPYADFTQLSTPMFYRNLALSQHHTQHLEHEFHPMSNVSFSIRHIKNSHEQMMVLNNDLYKPFNHHLHQTMFTVMLSNNSGCPRHTIKFELLYKLLAYNKVEYLGLQIPLVPNHNVSFYQDNTFESRTILIRSLEQNDNCYIYLRINPIHSIGLYSGPMEQQHDAMQTYNPKTERKKDPLVFIFLAPYSINLTWSDADTICRSAGGHLPTVTTEEEEDFLVHAIQARLPDATIKHTCKYYSLCYVFLGLSKEQVK